MEEISIKRKERHLYKREAHFIAMGVNLEDRRGQMCREVKWQKERIET
jgi:hypothetical protein